MQLTKEEFSVILNKWKSNLGVFSPYFKTTQLVSLSYMDNLQKVDIDENKHLHTYLEKILKGKNLSNTICLVDHSNHLTISYLLNNYFSIKPIFLMNNFIFHSNCIINNGNYANYLYSFSHNLNNVDNPKGFAFVVDKDRYFESHEGLDLSNYFLNEYEVSMYDLPDAKFLKKNAKIKNILFISEDNLIKEDIDNILHSYSKHFNVERYIIPKNPVEVQ